MGDAAILERDPGITDVLRVADDVDPHGLDPPDFAVGQGQDNVDVVDHDIENYTDVRRAERVGADAVGFDELRRSAERLHRLHDRVAALRMTHGHHGIVAPGQGYDPAALAHAGGQRLFDEDGNPAAEKRLGQAAGASSWAWRS